MSTKSVLIIDDESEIAAFIADVVTAAGFEAKAVTTESEFWEAYRAFDPSILIIDLMMPGTDGVELLRRLAEQHCSASIILISGYDARVLNTAQRLGKARGLDVVAAVQKPIKAAVLRKILREISDVRPLIDEQALRQGISSGEFVIHYQPKVLLFAPPTEDVGVSDTMSGESKEPAPRRGGRFSARLRPAPNRTAGVAPLPKRLRAARGSQETTWTLEGFEALVRWNHPQHGLLMPGMFVPLSEDTKLIRALTSSVLGQVLDQITHWAKIGFTPSVAVNIPAQLLSDLEFPDKLFSLAAEHKVDSSQLVLEVTESGVMTDLTRSMDILSRVRLKGFALSMDDFGTGYSSLVQLYRMPFSELKIDGSFVIELTSSDEAATIVTVIIDMAHKLGLTVCAEAVETEEVLQFLVAAGCDKAQGQYFSAPGPAAELEGLLGLGAPPS